MKKIIFLILFICVILINKSFAQEHDPALYSLQYRLLQSNEPNEKYEILYNLSYEMLFIDATKSLSYQIQAEDELNKVNIKDFIVRNTLRKIQIHRLLNDEGKVRLLLLSLAEQTIWKNDEEFRYLIEKGYFLRRQGNLSDFEAHLKKLSPFVQEGAYWEFLGDVYEGIDKIEPYKKALNIYETTKQYKEAAVVAQKISNFYIVSENTEGIVLYIQKVIDLSLLIPDKRLLADGLLRMGYIHLDKYQDYAKATDFFLQSLIVAKEYDFLNNQQKLKQALEALLKCYQMQTKKGVDKENASKYADYYVYLIDEMEKQKYAISHFKKITQTKLQQKEKEIVYVEVPNKNVASSNYSDARFAEQAKKIGILEALQESARLSRSKDSVLIIEKENEIKSLKQKHKQEIDSLQKEQNKIVSSLSEIRSNWWGWLLLLLIPLLLFTIWLLVANRLKKQQHGVVKKSLEEAKVELKRQNASLGARNDELNTKKIELENSAKELQEIKNKHETLKHIVKEEIKPNIEEIIEESVGLDMKRSLVYQRGKKIIHTIDNTDKVQTNTSLSLELSNNSLLLISKKAIYQLDDLLKQKNINFSNHIEVDSWVWCDANAIQQVLQSLLYNAISHSFPNGDISIKSTEGESNTCIITVQDNGIVIPTDLLNKVFEPQIQTDGRVSNLDLAFAFKVIEAHGKVLSVSSDEAIGTQFSFVLEKTSPQETLTTEVWENMTWISLSTQEKEVLAPYLKELKIVEYFETSKLKNILLPLTSTDLPNLQKWLQEMNDAIFKLKEGKYKQLINIGDLA
ncbi:MAG: hypothetical protein EAZ55_08625 [Cytophagales bacterium]|nr:MAG: hypothetical protein EAZ55_08625 [Cytophagales bacterium]